MADQVPDFIAGDTNLSNRVKAAWLNDVNVLVYRGTWAPAHNTVDLGTSIKAPRTGYFGTSVVTPLLDISGASAGQISFPAAQNASAGANVLDDYEEGGWTPSVGGTATYTTQGGQYTKIGNLVAYRCLVTINLIGTGSTTVITGLPFTPSGPATSVVNFTGSATSIVTLVAIVGISGGSDLTFKSLTAAGTGLGSNPIFANSTSVSLSGIYFTA